MLGLEGLKWKVSVRVRVRVRVRGRDVEGFSGLGSSGRFDVWLRSGSVFGVVLGLNPIPSPSPNSNHDVSLSPGYKAFQS